jgi:hypothetical protein
VAMRPQGWRDALSAGSLSREPSEREEIEKAIKILREDGNLDAIERINKWWVPERHDSHDWTDYDS